MVDDLLKAFSEEGGRHRVVSVVFGPGGVGAVGFGGEDAFVSVVDLDFVDAVGDEGRDLVALFAPGDDSVV